MQQARITRRTHTVLKAALFTKNVDKLQEGCGGGIFAVYNTATVSKSVAAFLQSLREVHRSSSFSSVFVLSFWPLGLRKYCVTYIKQHRGI